MKVSGLAGTIHVYPTYSIANQQLTFKYSIESFLGGTAGKVLRKLSGF